MNRPDAVRHPGLVGAAVLLVVYGLTLAPDVTFWDAGEFIAASHALGIPHPPGTPLYVLVINAWAKLFWFLPYAVATNLFSAAATAASAALSATLVHRATRNAYMAMAAALVAGGMSTAWLNATETEVYAASLLLGVVMIWAGDRAGRAGGERWTVLVAYLMMLAVPLHLSALVMAPVAILLAAYTADGVHWRRVVLLSGAFLLAMGVGRVSPWLGGAGAAVTIAGAFTPPRLASALARALPVLAVLIVGVIGATALAFLYVRAQYDPGINQGDPSTWQALTSVIARRQYAVSPIWPRMAPVWVQLGNIGQYADWQVALSTGPTVAPSLLRSSATAGFLLLGWMGAQAHWAADRRTALAVLALLACGSLGVAAYLNMHAGPSIAYQLLPNAVREARERDYFYVFAFWAWGLWAGVGAVVAVREWRRPEWTALGLAAIPLALNWNAVTRRAVPERVMPRAVAEALLESAPPNAVLFVAGDNDSYPVWYAQEVLGVRPDVTPVTLPLLPTRWYRREMARRHALLDSAGVAQFEPNLGTARRIAAAAESLGRPVVAALTLGRRERGRLVEDSTRSWTSRGYVYVLDEPGQGTDGSRVDSAAAAKWSAWFERTFADTVPRASVDYTNRYFMSVLRCSQQLLGVAQGGDSSMVAPVCNYR